MKMLNKFIIEAVKSPWLYILSVFVLTRLVLTAIGIFVIKLTTDLPKFPSAVYEYTKYEWLNLWGHWDTGWYTSIAKYGYSAEKIISGESVGQASYAFFPLYPKLVHYLTYIIPSEYISGIVISNTFLIIACYFLYKLFSLESIKNPLRSVKYLFIFPTAFLLSSVLTESTFLALTISSFYYARTNRWFLSGLLGMLSALTRSVGFLIFIPIIIEYMQSIGWNLRKIKINILWLLLIPVGLGIILFFNYRLTGDALAFISVQSAWGRQNSYPWVVLFNGLDLKNGAYTVFNAMFTLVGYLVLFLGYKKFRFSEWVICFYIITIPLMSSLVSMPRYFLAAFPFILFLSRISLNERIDSLITIIMLLLQGFLFVFWVMGTYLIM